MGSGRGTNCAAEGSGAQKDGLQGSSSSMTKEEEDEDDVVSGPKCPQVRVPRAVGQERKEEDDNEAEEVSVYLEKQHE